MQFGLNMFFSKEISKDKFEEQTARLNYSWQFIASSFGVFGEKCICYLPLLRFCLPEFFYDWNLSWICSNDVSCGSRKMDLKLHADSEW